MTFRPDLRTWTLLRHAESQSNARKIWTGQTDVPLSKKGEQDLVRIKKSGSRPQGDFFVSSPLRRCSDSLRLLYDREPDLIVEEFLECDLGAWVGLSYENLTTDPRYLDWLERPSVPPPGGESLEAFKKRALRGFKRTLEAAQERGCKKLILVLHGNVMRALLGHMVDPSRPHHEWSIPNNGGYRVVMEGSRAMEWETFCLS